MSAHTKTQRYCGLHHRWFNACCWECQEEGDTDHETQEEREQQRVETYREATRDEERIERN